VKLKGPIAWMAQNSVAANLFMFVIMVGGIIGLTQIKQEVFPEFDLDIVTVSVPYPGASPTDIEQTISLAIEERLRGLDGVKRVTSTSSEGVGTVTAELLLDANPDKVLQDVKSEVDRILTFPEDAERPEVTLLSRRQKVLSLIVSGEQQLSALHSLAERLRDEMLAKGGITQVELKGVPPLEISIEVPRHTLESLGLTLDDIARQVAAASLELPAGELRTEGGRVLVRLSDRRREGHQFERLIVKGTRDGSVVRLGDIATIRDGYEQTDQYSLYNGLPAVELLVYRVGSETPTSVSEAVHAYLDEVRPTVAPNVNLTVWADDSELLEQRIDLLVRNGRTGIVLVLIVLALFLEARLAMWVSVGIPVSFLGAFFLMPVLDVSVNMVSLFALIITLGMVVDDAIVVGENIYDKMESGMTRWKAAIAGAQEMATPVTFSILTTVAAFAPMLFVPGTSGKIFKVVPLVVISVLFFSLVESFFVLPAHLSHKPKKRKPNKVRETLKRWIDAPRIKMSALLARFTTNTYGPWVRKLIEYRYTAFAGAIAILMATIGAVSSGAVPFLFFPKLEGDEITASVQLPFGAPIEQTEAAILQIEESARLAVEQLGGDEYMVGMFTYVGEAAPTGGPGGGVGSVSSHLGAVRVELVPSGEREFSAEDFSGAWAELTPPLAGLESLSFKSSVGPGADAPVAIQLSHVDQDMLAQASVELTDALRQYPQLLNIQNEYSAGKPQLSFHLRENARTLGLTGQDVARQMRSAFYGAEAIREQRGRNEIKIMVRLPEAQRASEWDLESLMIRTPDGNQVPLGSVATFERETSPTNIIREDGRRVVTVSADLKPGVPSPREVLESLEANDIPALKAKYPGLGSGEAGQAREQGESFAALGKNFIFALFVMYALLAIPFKSYVQPAIIMAAIPFGFVGAVIGHVLMGFELSVISMFGIIALAGVVVNDSLVLIDAANRYRHDGLSPYDAIVAAGQRRLRPILLTSLTTFFGLAPMIFETSVQARFLIPMALSLGFGILFATIIVLLLIPALYIIVEDVRTMFDSDDHHDEDEDEEQADDFGGLDPSEA